MKKTAAELADQVLEQDPGQQAVSNKTKERWIAALVSGGLGTGVGRGSGMLYPLDPPKEGSDG
jgi:hypothetical protein